MSPSSLYNLAYSAGDLSDSKFVTKAEDPPSFKSERVEPTICFTFPLCISMQGRKRTAHRTETGRRRGDVVLGGVWLLKRLILGEKGFASEVGLPTADAPSFIWVVFFLQLRMHRSTSGYPSRGLIGIQI
uniref:Uncharacterized protein n=1 Tax=Opuntia streptacantha TaxID=393608 RepID=A0A7C9DDQ1_OPUST